MPSKHPADIPPIAVFFGDEEYRKSVLLREVLDEFLPPEVERSTALTTYDGTRPPDQDGPSLAAVLDDLATLPFLSDRRVVVVRDADRFISAHREALERYLEAPAATGVLLLECRSFPGTTRLSKAVVAAGGRLYKCEKLRGREVSDFVLSEMRARGKRIESLAAARLVDLVGPDQGSLALEVDKLCLYVADRATVTEADVAALVGQSREEKVFDAMDLAADGDLPAAIKLWQQVLAMDPSAVFRALGGVMYVLRRWLKAHKMRAAGMSAAEIAPKVFMFGRAPQLEALLHRLPAQRLRVMLASAVDLDSEAKTGNRSIESGIEALLVELAAPAA